MYTPFIDNQQTKTNLEQKEDPIIVFLALFNSVDKYFDKVLSQDKFLPFNEKVKRIIEWKYYISWFVKLHQYQLRYFGELRNFITHGIKIENRSMVIPSEHAIAKMKQLKQWILRPPFCGEVFRKKVYSCNINDLLLNILPLMKDNYYTHVPVYDNFNRFVGVLTSESVLFWLAENFDDRCKKICMNEVKISNVPIKFNSSDYMFVSKNTNIYEVDRIFSERKFQKKKLGAIFITENGKPNEEIIWVITSSDIAIIDSYIIR